MAGIMPRIIMTSLLLAMALCLTGCQPGPGLSEKSSGSGDTQNTVTVPETKGDTPVVESQDPPKSVGAGQTSSQEDKHRFVAERNFQLDKLQRVKIKVGKHVFNSWIMDTDQKRQEGMMFLKDTDFKDDDTMTFVFSGEDERRFWMHNTLVDLDICYCDKNGKIVKTYTMAKLDETTDYSSKGGAMYVIELKAGILKKLGIEKGMKFDIPEDVVSKDDGNG